MRNDTGFTLIEVVLALFLIAIGVIATAPMFVFAAKETAAGGDLGSVGAAAEQRMEVLRGTVFQQLANGGTLDSNSTGYFDDSDPGQVVRWSVSNNPNPPAGTKVVTVRAIATGTRIGARKDVTLVTVRGE